MRLIIIAIPLCLLTSCMALLELMTPRPVEEIIRELDLRYTSSTGLLGNIRVSGTIKNNAYYSVSGIKIKAIITHANGTYREDEFYIEVGIPPNNMIEFEHKFYTESTDKVTLRIVTAKDY